VNDDGRIADAGGRRVSRSPFAGQRDVGW